MRCAVALALAAIGCRNPSDIPAAALDAHEIRFPSASPPDPVSTPCTGQVGFPGLPALGDRVSNPSVDDMNGDSVPDLEFLDQSGLNVALGHGDGTFGSPTSFAIPPLAGTSELGLTSLRIADLNGDGRSDLVMARSTSTTPSSFFEIQLYLNDGAGGFAPWRNLIVPTETPAITGLVEVLAVADLNGDGTMDVVARQNAAQISVWLSTGTSYAAAQAYPIALNSGPILTGDVTGDGLDDVIVSNGSELRVFANIGTGILAAAVRYPAAFNQPRLVDLNEDGRLDIVLLGDVSAGKSVGVMLNQGGGIFGAATVFPVSSPGSSWLDGVETGDVDGDGHLDLIVRGEVLLRGTGTGSLESPRPFIIGSSSLVDVNLDGRPDLVTSSTEGGISVTLHDGTPNPYPIFETRYLGMAEEGRGVRWTDLNGDGLLDLIGTGSDGVVSTRLGTGGGEFAATTTSYPTSVTASPTDGELLFGESLDPTVLADVDNDDHQDLLVLGDDTIQTLLNRGDGTLTAVSPSGNTGTSMVTGDFDRDGLRDLIVPGRSWSSGGPSGMTSVEFRRGLGNGQFKSPIALWQGIGPVRAAALDVDSDGLIDVVVEEASMRTISFGRGDGTFTQRTTPLENVGRPRFLVAHDLNADGKQDLISDTEGGTFTALSNGDGTFSQRIPVGRAGLPAFADFNGDGHIDTVIHWGTGIAVQLGRGDGSFQAPLFYPARGRWSGSISVGDVDNDGRVDILLQGERDEVNVLRGRCL